MTKVEITDEMVERFRKAWPWMNSCSGDLARVLLDKTLNPPCPHKWRISNTPYVYGNFRFMDYTCDLCGEHKQDNTVTSTLPAKWPGDVTEEMIKAANNHALNAHINGSPFSNQLICDTYRAMRALEPRSEWTKLFEAAAKREGRAEVIKQLESFPIVPGPVKGLFDNVVAWLKTT